MMRLGIFLALMVVGSGAAHAQAGWCVTSGSFVWGYNASWSGSVKTGQSCSTSYASDIGAYLGHKITAAPRNGTLRVIGVSNGVPSFVYQPRAGFSGSDVFTIELTGASMNWLTGTPLPASSTQITYNMTVKP